MNEAQRQELIALFEQHAKSIGAMRGWCDTLEATLNAMRDRVFADGVLEGGDPPARVLFASPVTGKVGDVFGGDWFIATNYAEYYTATGKGAYHTGCDLNRPGFKDSGAPVYAAADGDVVISRIVPGWQGVMVVIKHTLEDGRSLWTRYAHLKDPLPIGQTILHVKRGDMIGKIGDYTPVNDPRGDHCHYDGAWKDLGKYPDDWPGSDLARLKNDYIDMVPLHKDRSK